jgi:hypothetical protein
MSKDGPGRWVDKTAFVMPLLPLGLKVDPVFAALLHCVAFLELSGDDTVEPDWALEATEYVAGYLQRLSAAEAAGVRTQLAAVSSYAREQGAPDTFIKFVDGFLEACGLDPL